MLSHHGYLTPFTSRWHRPAITSASLVHRAQVHVRPPCAIEILGCRAAEILVHAAADASMPQAIFSSSHKHLTNTTSAKRLELGGAMAFFVERGLNCEKMRR